MGLVVDWVNVDTPNPQQLAQFWKAVLGYRELYASDADASEGEVLIGPAPGERGPRLLFYEVHDEKVVKNRLHFDLRPDDQEAEVDRLLGLGARRIDIGQGPDVTWVVMADPEGNEFCILRPREGTHEE